jgi:hypothetical protein
MLKLLRAIFTRREFERCRECDVVLRHDRVRWAGGFPACPEHVDRVLWDTAM